MATEESCLATFNWFFVGVVLLRDIYNIEGFISGKSRIRRQGKQTVPIIPGRISILFDRVRRSGERTLEPHREICGAECSEEEYCHGCGFYICSDCDNGTPYGKHELSDHNS